MTGQAAANLIKAMDAMSDKQLYGNMNNKQLYEHVRALIRCLPDKDKLRVAGWIGKYWGDSTQGDVSDDSLSLKSVSKATGEVLRKLPLGSRGFRV